MMNIVVETVAFELAELSSMAPFELGLVVHETGWPLHAFLASDHSEDARPPITPPTTSATTPPAPEAKAAICWLCRRARTDASRAA